MQETKLKKDWSLTPGAFHRLLTWLDEGADSEGQKYLEMRRRLVAYFDRKNCPAPDELADETLNRVARRLEEERATRTELIAALVLDAPEDGAQLGECVRDFRRQPVPRARARRARRGRR